MAELTLRSSKYRFTKALPVNENRAGPSSEVIHLPVCMGVRVGKDGDCDSNISFLPCMSLESSSLT